MDANLIEAPAPRILPPLDEANTAFWTGGARGQLMISHCSDCDRWVHPPALECPGCGGTLVPRAVRGTGTVLTYTVNWHQYHPDVAPPYVIAIVELDEQADLRIPTNIVHCDFDSLRCGLPVRVVFEQHGDVSFPVFEPVHDVAAG